MSKPVDLASPERKRPSDDAPAGTPNKIRVNHNRFCAFGTANSVIADPFVHAMSIGFLVDYEKLVLHHSNENIKENLFELANAAVTGQQNKVSAEEWDAWMAKRFGAKEYSNTNLCSVLRELKITLFGGLVSIKDTADECVTWVMNDGKEATAGDLLGCPPGPVWVVDLYLKVLGMDDYAEFWVRLESLEDAAFIALWHDILETARNVMADIESKEEDGPFVPLAAGMEGRRKCLEVRLQNPFMPPLQAYTRNPGVAQLPVAQPQFLFKMDGLAGMHNFMGLLAAKAVSPPAYGGAGHGGDFPVRTFVCAPETFVQQPDPQRMQESLTMPRAPPGAQVNWMKMHSRGSGAQTPQVLPAQRISEAQRMQQSLKEGQKVTYAPNMMNATELEKQQHGCYLFKKLQGSFRA